MTNFLEEISDNVFDLTLNNKLQSYAFNFEAAEAAVGNNGFYFEIFGDILKILRPFSEELRVLYSNEWAPENHKKVRHLIYYIKNILPFTIYEDEDSWSLEALVYNTKATITAIRFTEEYIDLLETAELLYELMQRFSKRQIHLLSYDNLFIDRQGHEIIFKANITIRYIKDKEINTIDDIKEMIMKNDIIPEKNEYYRDKDFIAEIEDEFYEGVVPCNSLLELFNNSEGLDPNWRVKGSAIDREFLFAQYCELEDSL